MINLAPIRYARALREKGGPIDRLEGLDLGKGTGPMYQVNAYLSEDLDVRTKMSSIFNQADGCGTSNSLLVARHKAISEALERWALYHLHHAGKHEQSGMDLDSSSAGMAAFPGLWARPSRERAQSEAIERHTLARWATGQASCRRINTEIPNVSGIELQTPFRNHHVVLLWKAFRPEQYAYGFSAALTESKAVRRARIEMDRLSSALKQLQAFHTDSPDLASLPIENTMERRILHFSGQTGHQQFLSHVEASLKKKENQTCPRPVFDSQLKGPWDQYTTVWRVLYPMPGEIYNEDPTLFYW